MPINLLLIGPPGVGKGTQAALLRDRLGLVPLASGEVFRAEIAAGSDLGKQAQEFILKGQLVPDELTIDMMRGRITSEEVANSGFVFDGFPRTIEQAKALDKLLAEHCVEIDRAISLELDDEVVIDRLSGRRLCPNCGELYHLLSKSPREEGVCDKCGAQLSIRKDDRPSTIRQRLLVFHETTSPILVHYASQGKVYKVDGNQSSEDVYAQITEGLTA